MSNENVKNKKYEPPVIKEIGGVFEQAVGLSTCVTGSMFKTNCSAGATFGAPCRTGPFPNGGCARGYGDQPTVCTMGKGVTGCSRGFFG